MAKVPSKHSRDQAQDFEVLLNNLNDWELSFKDKDKKLRPEAFGKGKVEQSNQPSRKQTMDKTTSSGNANTVKQYDYLKAYEALSRLSSGVPSQESFVDANSEKELGNECFKQKKFNEAIDCYSRSIALSQTAVAYANRAMAYIKIKRFQEAENDCTEALNLDDRYVKAYSRRSTARKELGKLKESIDDAAFALRLEPQNHELKRQYAESKSLLEKEVLKRASAALAEVEKNKTLQKHKSVSTSSPSGLVAEILEDHPNVSNVREVAAETSIGSKRNSMRSNGSDADASSGAKKGKPKNSKQELRASVQELAAKAAILAKVEAAKNIVPPTSAYQFETSWRGLSGDRQLQARLLKVTSPSALPGIFKNSLSAPMLVDIIRCIAAFFMEDMALGVEYLQNMTKIPRFDMIIMCLSSADKADLFKIWDEVFSSKETSSYAEILGNLRPRYGIKQ